MHKEAREELRVRFKLIVLELFEVRGSGTNAVQDETLTISGR